MNRSTWRNLGVVAAGIAVMTAVATLSNDRAQAQAPRTATRVPVFEVDPSWPKLPNNWVLGHVASVGVDSRDHVFMLHRPNTVPEAQRKAAAPPVLEFDATGKFVNAWGGPGQGYDWPDSEHGIAVDYKNNVWIGGSAPVAPSLRNLDDDMLLKFDNKGKFLLQIGGRSTSKGNADTQDRAPVGRRLRVAQDQRGVRRRRLRQPPRDRVRRRHRRVQADVGRVRQHADRCGACSAWRRRRRRGSGRRCGSWCAAPRRRRSCGAARCRSAHRYRGARIGAVRRPGARRQGVERRARLRGRPSQPSRAGVHAGRQVRHAGVHQSRRPVGAVGRRTRVLSRRAAAVPLRGRLRQLAHRRRSIARACRSCISSVSAARSRATSRVCITWRSTRRATSTPARSRRAHARSASSTKGCRTRCRPTRVQDRARQHRASSRTLSGARFRRRARQLSHLGQRHDQPVHDDAELAAAGHHQAGRGDRHHPRRQGRHLAAPSLRAADPLHRSGRQRDQAVRQRHVRAGARLLPGPRRQLLGGRQRTVRRTIRRPRVAASSCSSSAPTARCCCRSARPACRRPTRRRRSSVRPRARLRPTATIIVADGHWPRPTDAQQDGDRLVRIKTDGSFVAEYGKLGTGPGEFMGPHALAFDSQGRLFVADRSNNRVQVFDRNMQFVDEWRHFGRPSGIAILA